MDNNSVKNNSNESIDSNVKHDNSDGINHYVNSVGRTMNGDYRNDGVGRSYESSTGGAVSDNANGYAASYNSSPMYSWPQSPFLPAQPPIQGFGLYSNPALGLGNAFSGLSLYGGVNNQHAFESQIVPVGDVPSINIGCYDAMNNAYNRVEGLTPFYNAHRRPLMNHHHILRSDQFQNGGQLLRSSLGQYNNHYFTPYPSKSDFYRDTNHSRSNELRGVGVRQHVPVTGRFGSTGLAGLDRKLFSCGMEMVKDDDVFKNISRFEFDMLFGELLGNISYLMMHQYGKLLFEKLVQVCSVNQRNEIIAAITRDTNNLGRICLNAHGTRAVQKLLEYLTTESQMRRMVTAIKPNVLRLSKDSNGHHVVVHCILHFPLELSQVIFDVVARHCFDVAIDKSGCCVLQKCMDYSRGETRQRLMQEIISIAQLLCEDRYGNYVVQHLMTQEAHQSDRLINYAGLLKKLKGKFVSLSCNKFGSNVVEKLLENADKRHVELIIMEMLESPNVSTLFSDQFGNYVVQAALSFSKGYAHDALVREIQKHAPSLRSNQFGKKTLSWFDTKKRYKGYNNGKPNMLPFHH